MFQKSSKLVGQSGLTDDQIKQKRSQKLFVKVAPGQPMTMDYRSNRVTVTIDPTSKNYSSNMWLIL